MKIIGEIKYKDIVLTERDIIDIINHTRYEVWEVDKVSRHQSNDPYYIFSINFIDRVYGVNILEDSMKLEDVVDKIIRNHKIVKLIGNII